MLVGLYLTLGTYKIKVQVWDVQRFLLSSFTHHWIEICWESWFRTRRINVFLCQENCAPKKQRDVAPFIASTGRCTKSLTWRPQRDGHNRPRRNGQTWRKTLGWRLKIRFSPCAEQSWLENVGFRHNPTTTVDPQSGRNLRNQPTVVRKSPSQGCNPWTHLRLWRDAIPVRLWISRSLWTHALLPWHHLCENQDWVPKSGTVESFRCAENSKMLAMLRKNMKKDCSFFVFVLGKSI